MTIKEIYEEIKKCRFENNELELYYANELIEKGEFSRGYYFMGDAKLQQGELHEAFSYFNKAMEIQIEKEEFENLSETYNSQGIACFLKGDEYGAIDYFLKSYKIAKDMKNGILRGRIINNMGYIYMKLKDIKTALIYFEHSNRFLIEKEEEEIIYETAVKYINITLCYLELEDIKNAKKYFELYKKIYNRLEDRKISKIYEKEIMARIYYIENDFEKSKKICKSIIKEGEQAVIRTEAFDSFYNIAELLLKYNEFEDAKQIIDNLYKKATKEDNYHKIRNCILLYLSYYELKGDMDFTDKIYESYFEKFSEMELKTNKSIAEGMDNRLRLYEQSVLEGA